MRRNPIQASFGCQPLMSDIPGSIPWILLTLLAAVATVPLSNLSMTAGVEISPLPVTVETRIATEGYDRRQRRLPLTVYVLTQQLSWKLESTVDLEGGQPLLGPELIVAINRARDVFCVGTASFEGVSRSEEARAARRAAKLAQWVAAVVRNPSQTRLFTLNAGQYKGPNEPDSAYQRKAIIIATGPHDDEVNLSEALTSGLEREQQTFPVVYSLLHRYSRSSEWLKIPNKPGETIGRGNENAGRGRLAESRVRR
jgi:hypothetical protein